MPNDDVVRRGRLAGDRKGEMAHFLSSMRADRCIADADILVDIAHLIMLCKQQLVTPANTRVLMGALLELYDNGVPESAFDDHFEDIHAGIESTLIAMVGEEAGGRLHMGRSRNDEVAACIRIRLREDLQKQLAALLGIRSMLLNVAEAHTETYMPGFTHLQHAQPTTLAHHLLAYEQAFSRDFDRLNEAFARVNMSPLGAAAFASTSYPVNRELTAKLLGFDGIIENTMDAVGSRDFALEALNDISLMMITVSRLCEELIIWSSQFVGFVTLDDTFCSTSSIMPQKKNPDTAEIMRAKSGVVLGACVGAAVTMKALPMSYNRDLQELTPHLWRGVRAAKQSTRLLIDMLGTATFHVDRMREEANRGFSTATDLADMIVRRLDLPFRTAHSIVGRAVQKGSLDIRTLDEASIEIAQKSLSKAGLIQEQVDEALGVVQSVSLRRAPGAPSPFAVKVALAGRKEVLKRDTGVYEARQARLSASIAALLADARKMVA